MGTNCFGEAFSDFVFFNDASWITRDRAIAAGAVLILIAYGIQLATKKYIPLVWCTVTFLGPLLIPLGAWAYAKFYVRPGNEKAYQFVAVAAFWVAYTITRPLGASFGDYLAVPAPYGDGLQIGTGPVSLYSGIALAIILAVVTIRYYRPRSGIQTSLENVSVTAE
ncbi:MAG TPA: hypothetical protein VGD91_21400 [Trebonia sp.]